VRNTHFLGSTTGGAELRQELVHTADELARLIESALQLPEPPGSWWHRAGVSPRAERWLEVVSSLVLMTLAVAWLWTIVVARSGTTATEESDGTVTPATRAVGAALTSRDAPTAAYLTDAALAAFTPLRGASGKVRLVQQAPGEPIPSAIPHGAAVTYGPGDSAAARAAAPASAATADTAGTPGGAAPARPGIWQLAVRVGTAVRPVTDLNVATLKPLSARRNGRIGLYYIGRWPTEGRAASGVTARGNYAPPRGLIEVTRANQNTQLSEHLRLRDFLTHDQQNVWPKYVVVQTRLVDKLELVLDELARRGIRGEGIYVMSGFRTPQYNTGGGNTGGRANLSRHMYGDAADIWIDNDRDGRMDDLNRDGRVDIRDSEVIRAAVDRVEQAYPELVGGVGVYPGNAVHGPFAHIDARGYRARWIGSGDGG
jgi:uncharacterized protein YcbK (DUF882 family)